MYKIYFYSNPNFLYIDSESIIDLDLKIIDDKKCFEMEYDDDFFYLNLKNAKSKNWGIIIQSFDEKNNFVLQSDLNGEKMKSRKLKKTFYFRVEYDQITNNKAWPSIPPIFEQGEINFKNDRIYHMRNIKLQNFLISISYLLYFSL